MAEKVASGGTSRKVGSCSVLPKRKGSKSKKKAIVPAQKNAVNFPMSNSEAFLCDLPADLFRNHALAPLVPDEEDDPSSFHLTELLIVNLHAVFQTAIKKIVHCGYTEDAAERAISRRGLYQGGDDLVSNVMNDALESLKKGKRGDITMGVFERSELVQYTLLEMITVLREAKPSLSMLEALWWLLMFDLNILEACALEGDILPNFDGKEVSRDSSSDSTSQLRYETQNSNVSKVSFPSPENPMPEKLNFESFPSLPNSKNPIASGDYVPVAYVSRGKSEIGQKGRSKKELAALRKHETFGKGVFRTKRHNGGFVVEKRMESPSELPTVDTKNASSKTISEAGDFANESDSVLTNSSPGLIVTDKTSTLLTKGIKSVVGTINTELAPSSSLGNKSAPSSSKTLDNEAEKKLAPKAGDSTLMSPKPADYCVGIPYDESQGKYIPQSEQDELILKIVPRLEELQNKFDSWTQWTNQKVMQVACRLSKEQAELKSLRREKEEAEKFQKENQIVEEKTLKKLFEMESALSYTTQQFLDANSMEEKLVAKHSLLKMEMGVAKIEAEKLAAKCLEATEKQKKALKDVQSLDGERSLLQKELASEKQKAVELQQKVDKVKNIYSQTEMTWKQEIAEKEKLLEQAASLMMEQESLKAAAKMQAREIKERAEKDKQKHEEEIQNLEKELSELKMKLDSAKIEALKKGTFDGNVNIKDYSGSSSGSRGLKPENECVMCLSEEKVVVFLPCAHQVLCVTCNEIHQKQGMKDCPACRAPIVCRIRAHFARP